MESTFSKYLLNESYFGSTAKRSVIDIVRQNLEQMKKKSTSAIGNSLSQNEMENGSEIAAAISKEMSRMNAEYITQLTEWINTRRWSK